MTNLAGAVLAYVTLVVICGVAVTTMVMVLQRADGWLRARTRPVAGRILFVAFFALLFLGAWLPASLYLVGRHGARRFRRTLANVHP